MKNVSRKSKPPRVEKREAIEAEIVDELERRGGFRRGSMKSLAFQLAGGESYYRALKRLRLDGVIRVSEEEGNRSVRLAGRS